MSSEADSRLIVQSVGVQFGGLDALREVDLTVSPGEVVAVIGPNGAGKTTMLNVLSGLIGGGRITGRVMWGSTDLIRAPAVRRRRLGISRTFQHAEVFSELTVLENLLATRRFGGRAHRERSLRILESVGLGEVAHEMPDDLPFGLRKRLDLARAISESPKLLLLDEPFGGLDAAERELTITTLRRIRDEYGTAILIIDHVLGDLMSVAERAIAFDFGIPIMSGTPEQVLSDPRVQEAYLGLVTTAERQRTSRQAGAPLVTLTGVRYDYQGVEAIRDIDLEVRRGEILAIAGANGAGKSTLGKVLQGSIRPGRGSVVTDRAARRAHVPEGRALFTTLSVRENLEVGGYGAGLRGRELRAQVERTIEWLPPRVKTRLDTRAGSLSGGEQQMLAIARSLVAEPDLLILDEPALGLAPALVEEVYSRIEALVAQGTTIVLLEQLLERAFDVSDRVAVIRDGVIRATGSAEDPAFRELAKQEYFGSIDELG